MRSPWRPPPWRLGFGCLDLARLELVSQLAGNPQAGDEGMDVAQERPVLNPATPDDYGSSLDRRVWRHKVLDLLGHPANVPFG